MTRQNQIYFEISEFARDISNKKIERNLTYKNIAEEAGCSLSVVRNLFNLCRCSVDTLVILCEWANLDPRQYFLVAPYK